MINFIIVDDLNFWLNEVENKINKVLFNSTINYKTYKFLNYNTSLYNMVFQNLENKVYILDIEVDSENGIDVARKIRNFDKTSEIIILTSYSKEEYISNFLTSSIKALAFIDKSKIDILDLKIKEIINNFALEKVLKINTISSFFVIKIQDILYVEIKNRKTLIHTTNSIIKTSKNLHFIEEKLKKECDFFVRTHRACIVNLNNVISFDFKDKKITFFNNKRCHLLSKSYKNIIKNKIKNF